MKRLTKLCDKLSRKGFIPEHAAEVGVYHPETSNIYNYIIQGIKCTLVEPDQKSVELIKNHFSDFPNLNLYPVAVYDYNGEISLVQRLASTFVSELTNSPAIINDGYKMQESDKFVVECKTFDQIDDGSIDLLSLDVEGSEWYVIKHMVSRPKVISIETHGAIYVNPFLNKILEWMKKNDYAIWYKTDSDTVFVKTDYISINTFERISLNVKNCNLLFKKMRKKLKRDVLQS